MQENKKLPVTILRGGTSKGVYILQSDLPEDKSAWDTPGIPKMTFVAEAADYVNGDGKEIKKDQIDLLSRMMSMQKTHPSYAMTGAIIMSSYSASKETTNEELNKIFKFLFLLSVANVLLNVLLSWLGVFKLGGLF